MKQLPDGWTWDSEGCAPHVERIALYAEITEEETPRVALRRNGEPVWDVEVWDDDTGEATVHDAEALDEVLTHCGATHPWELPGLWETIHTLRDKLAEDELAAWSGWLKRHGLRRYDTERAERVNHWCDYVVCATHDRRAVALTTTEEIARLSDAAILWP